MYFPEVNNLNLIGIILISMIGGFPPLYYIFKKIRGYIAKRIGVKCSNNFAELLRSRINTSISHNGLESFDILSTFHSPYWLEVDVYVWNDKTFNQFKFEEDLRTCVDGLIEELEVIMDSVDIITRKYFMKFTFVILLRVPYEVKQ